MTENAATRVMRRKAGAGRQAPDVGKMTLPRAWKIAMPRAAEQVFGVQASVLKADEARVLRDDLAPLVTENALITMMEGPAERFGVAIIDATVLASLIEASTTGRVSNRPIVARAPTRTDAIISADVLDALLEGFEAELAEMQDAPVLGGYRYAAPLTEARSMLMTLADGPYTTFRLLIELGGGARQGEIVVAFPVAPQRRDRRADVEAFRQALCDNVLGAPTLLDAALHRIEMPLSAVTELSPGDVLHIPLSALAAVEVAAVGGRRVAQARLGQQGGLRAVRILRVAGEDGNAAESPSTEFEEAAPAVCRVALTSNAADPGRRSGARGAAISAGASAEGPVPDGAALPDLPAFGGSNHGDLPDLVSLTGSDDLPDLPELPPLDGPEGELDLPELPTLGG